MNGTRRDIWFLLTTLVLCVLVVFLLYPLLNTLRASFIGGGNGSSGWSQLLGEAKYRDAIVNTIGLGLAVTLTATLIGAPLAFFTCEKVAEKLIKKNRNRLILYFITIIY